VDKALFDDPVFRNFYLASIREAFIQGVAGPALDARIMFSNWGFQVSEIEFPVTFFHGTEDHGVKIGMGEWKHSQIPNSTFHRLEGMGHLDACIQFEIFLTYAASMQLA
jgi:pimeloyl-ACP methyl ester carboxylesterase